MLTVIDFPKIAGANSPIFKIACAKAPTAPVLNRPLHTMGFWYEIRKKYVTIFSSLSIVITTKLFIKKTQKVLIRIRFVPKLKI